MASFAIGCVRQCFFFINLLVFICSILTVIASAYFVSDSNTSAKLPVEMPKTAFLLLLIFGAGTSFVSCIGCYGSFKEAPSVLYIYALILIIAFGAVIVALGFTFSYRESIEELVDGDIKDNWYKKNFNEKVYWENVVHDWQKTLKW